MTLPQLTPSAWEQIAMCLKFARTGYKITDISDPDPNHNDTTGKTKNFWLSFEKSNGKGKQLVNYITRESESSRNTSTKTHH
jgi:hypothetical protein